MSDSVWPHRWQLTRLPRPWDSPGKNTGVGCHFLLQCMKVKSEGEVAQSCPTLSDSMDCNLPGSSVHGIFQARVLEWGAIAFSEQLNYWELIRNGNSWAPPQTCWLRNWGMSPSMCVLTGLLGSSEAVKVWKMLPQRSTRKLSWAPLWLLVLTHSFRHDSGTDSAQPLPGSGRTVRLLIRSTPQSPLGTVSISIRGRHIVEYKSGLILADT